MNEVSGIFTENDAKTQAVDLWNRAITGIDKSKIFIIEANSTFSRLKSLLKEKNFVYV